MPATEQNKCAEELARYMFRWLYIFDCLHRRPVGICGDLQGIPELLCLWAAEQDMCCCLFRCLAGFTYRVVDNVFLHQVCFAFDSLLGEQPGELCSWPRYVLPDKGCPGIRCGVLTLEGSVVFIIGLRLWSFPSVSTCCAMICVTWISCSAACVDCRLVSER